jgi:hypothetical protein
MKVLATPTNALLCLSNFPIWQREHKRLSQNYQKNGTDSQDRTGKEFPPADFTYHYSFHYQINAVSQTVYICYRFLFVVWTMPLPYLCFIMMVGSHLFFINLGR